MAEELDPMTWAPVYSFTDAPMPLPRAWDGAAPMDIYRYRLGHMLTIERARRNPMLQATNSAGQKLYKLSDGGNLRRVFPLSPRVVREVKERDGHTCTQCGETRNLEIDHIVRYVDGGSNKPENLRTLCSGCHRKRGGRREDPFHKA